MAASKDPAAEFRSARRWFRAMLALTAAAFAYGVWHSPPVVFVHTENAEQLSRQRPEKGTPPPPPPPEQEEKRPTVLPWLYLLKR